MSITYNKSKIIDQPHVEKSFSQKIKIGLKIIFWKIMFWCFLGISFAVCGKILVVIKNGHAISYKTLTAAVDELEATEENERFIYQQNAYKHFAKTYSPSVARKIAEKETIKYFDARAETRLSDLEADNKLVDGMAEETEKGGFISRLVKTVMPEPQSQETSSDVDLDLEAMQQRNKDVTSSLFMPTASEKRKKNVGKYEPKSSLPSDIGSGRKGILREELHQKNLQLDMLHQKYNTSDPATSAKIKKQIDRIGGDIDALKKEMKM